MPSVTLYIKDAEYIKLIKEPNPSKLIQQLLQEHYREPEKRDDSAKEPKVENGSSA